MKKISISLLLLTGFVLMSGHPVYASPPADNVIATALADVERLEGQAAGLTPSSKSGATRIFKLAKLSHDRLQGSANQGDPSWIEVNQRYLDLKAGLQALINPVAAPAASATTAAQTTVAAPAAQSTAPAAATAANEAVAPSAAGSTAPPLVSGQRVRVQKLTRDMMGSRGSIVSTGPSEFQDPDVVAARQKGLGQYREAIEKYPQLDDPDVQAARREYDALREALSAEFNRAREQLAIIGDVQQALATIESNARQYAAPAPLAVPFSKAEATAWVEAASSARTVAEHNLKQLETIAPLAYLPNNPGTPQTGSPYDANDVNRLQRNAAGMLEDVQSGYESMASELDNRMQQIDSELATRWQEDPQNDDKRWLFLAEGQQEEADRFYAEAAAIANASVNLERALNREPAQALATLQRIERARAEFARKRQLALEGSRLPEAKSNDREMLGIAREIVENPKYEFGEHGEIVLTTADIVERERKDSEVEIDDAELTLSGDLKLSGTETTWTYKWQEFKFAVPLKETGSDEWYIWWITAKNFSSGGPRTPLDRWISGEANKGNLILEKNLD